MSDVRVPVWGLCPFRSPVVPREALPDLSSCAPDASDVPREPLQALGPCLYAGCGLWKVTKVTDGQPVDGMCGVRFLGEMLEQLVKLQATREARDAEVSGLIFNRSPPPRNRD